MGCTLDIYWDHFLMRLCLVSARPIVEMDRTNQSLMVGKQGLPSL